MEKEDFYALIVITGLFTFLTSSFFFIGNENTYRRMLEDVMFEFLQRWFAFTLIGFLLFVGIGFIIWLLGRLVENDVKDKKRILFLGFIAQIIGSFIGCVSFFKLL